MAFLQSIILGSTSFLLGLVFVCQIIDIPLLYHTHLTEASLESAYAFYTMWYDAPKAVKALLHTALGIPLLAIVSKLHGWSESAVFFDGSCLVLHMASIVIYLTIHVPNLPVFGEFDDNGHKGQSDMAYDETFSPFDLIPGPSPHLDATRTLPVKSSNLSPDMPTYTEEEKQEAVRVLSAGNALVGFVSPRHTRPHRITQHSTRLTLPLCPLCSSTSVIFRLVHHLPSSWSTSLFLVVTSPSRPCCSALNIAALVLPDLTRPASRVRHLPVPSRNHPHASRSGIR